ncbi:putative transmembrane protein [Candidatus Accumulibacter phosphatis]|uniref:Transporter component n=2 Tax=Candidatus Accumulibacter TaxID=327159 RepID=A0A080M1P1_9PROT|nr:MAG: putative transporter component [Candidatus Accumulibacter cognatus]TMQ74564.1 putative transmembrane protein [Candidatus Accumulibacter phosphatis]
MITIDWLHFTPASAFAGGLLIGLAAALLILLEGRIAGISGIVGGLLQPLRKGDVAWRAAFALGLVAAPLLYQALAELPQSRIDTGWATLIVAGALVGFGSRLGSGCTSGHGVCGLSRRSPRSLVATLVFMSAGFATVFASRHLFA